MDINKIEILLRAIELNSLSKAAEEYLYTPSALSYIVDSIEKELGVKIIKRTHTGIEVVDENRDILECLKKIAETKAEMQVLVAQKIKKENILTIGTYSSLSKYILPEITKKFRQENPEIKIKIIVADDLSVLMKEIDADVFFGEDLKSENYIWKEIMTDPYAAVFPLKTNILDEVFHQDKKYEETLIVPNDSKTEKYLNKDNYRDVLTIQSVDDSSVIQMIKAEMGFTVLPMLSLESSRDQVKIIPLEPALERRLGLNYKKDRKNITLKKFIEYFAI